MVNQIKNKFQERHVTFGTFHGLDSTIAIECLKYSGLDYVIIDTEHGQITSETASRLIAACDCAQLTPFVRISEISRPNILKNLDMGAKGLIIPNISSPTEVETVIQHARFTPEGNRGYCPNRFCTWGDDSVCDDGMVAYFRQTNENILIVPQCETVAALESIEQIAQMHGVDGIMVGPFDLSVALGKPGELEDREVVAAIARVLAACQKFGKQSYIFAGSTAKAKDYRDQGFTSIVVGLDILVLKAAYTDFIKEIKGN